MKEQLPSLRKMNERGPATAPPSNRGRKQFDLLHSILKGRTIKEMVKDEKDMSYALKVCLEDLKAEWNAVSLENDRKIQQLQIQQLQIQQLKVEGKKRADRAMKVDPLLNRAEAWLSLVQRRAARFEKLSELYDLHRRGLRAKYAARRAARHTNPTHF